MHYQLIDTYLIQQSCTANIHYCIKLEVFSTAWLHSGFYIIQFIYTWFGWVIIKYNCQICSCNRSREDSCYFKGQYQDSEISWQTGPPSWKINFNRDKTTLLLGRKNIKIKDITSCGGYCIRQDTCGEKKVDALMQHSWIWANNVMQHQKETNAIIGSLLEEYFH